MTTPQSSRVRPVFRVLAALLVIAAFPLLVMGLFEPQRNWHFTAALLVLVLLFGYAAITGKAPSIFR
jgi:hypothetical membrane protein